MANTLSVMTNVLRNVVSKQRIRYKEKGFNLDLAYICDNIIAMGYPAENIEKIYRNRLEDVYKFLEENHHDHYKIYNLCLERSYDVNKFHGRVAAYPFEDHNPPTIELIQGFCTDVDAWLKSDTNNVAAVHCKAGKGRTGTMICCYLLYSNQQQTAEDALAYYDEKRTKDRKGVTIPSQRRYVQYFAKLLRSNLRYERRYLEFFEIRFTEAQSLLNQGTVLCAISALQDSCGCLKVQPLLNLNIDFRKSFTLDMKNFALRVSGDIKVELLQKTPKKKILHFWFNTYFICDAAVMEGEGANAKLVYTLNKYELDDAHKDKEHKLFAEDFKVQLAFYNEFGENTSLNRSNDNHRHTYHASTSNVLRASTATTTLEVATPTIINVEGNSNSRNYDLHLNCDHQAKTTASNASNTLHSYDNLMESTTTTIVTKPISNHNLNATTSERRPTSLIALQNSSPHKLQTQQQKLQQYRRCDMLLSSTTIATAPALTTVTTALTTQNLSSCSNHQRQKSQHQPKHILHKNTSNHNNTTTTATTSGCKINSQSNISNSSNSSINSHITSVSSSTSLVSGGCDGGGIKHQQVMEDYDDDEEEDDNEDDDDDHDDDDDDDDEAEREDNEEDWESGESAVNKPLPITSTTTHNTTPIRNSKQLVTTTTLISTTSTTSTTTTTTIYPSNTTTTATACCKYDKKRYTNQMHMQQENSSGYFNKIGDLIRFNNDNRNKVNLDDDYNDYDVDDDDDDDDENVIEGINNDVEQNNEQLQQEKVQTRLPANNYHLNNNCIGVTTTPTAKCTSISKRSSSNKLLMSNLASRYKIMQLLSAKASNKVMAPKHSYFKRKSLTKQTKPITNSACTSNDCYMLAGATGGNSDNRVLVDVVDGIENICGDTTAAATASAGAADQLRTRTTSVGSSGGCTGGVGGGLAKASKLKLKMSFSKTNSKLKWTQKFHWLQNYVRSADAAADLRKTLAQSTSSQRLNSNSSNNYNNLNIMKSTTNTTTTTKIDYLTPTSTTVDYYSSICDNQLSFNNSPCKSPQKQHLQQQQKQKQQQEKQQPNLESETTRIVDNVKNVVVIAARPANIEAIGFNIVAATTTTKAQTTTPLCNNSNQGSGSGSNSSSGYATASTLHSDSSIFNTPPTSLLQQHDQNEGEHDARFKLSKISPFVFPNLSEEITELAHVLKTTNLQPITTTTITDNRESGHVSLRNGSIKPHEHKDDQARA